MAEGTVARWLGGRQELEESGWSGSPPATASRSLGRLKRSVIWSGMGKVFPLAWAEAGCRDRSRVRCGRRGAPRPAWTKPALCLLKAVGPAAAPQSHICHSAPILGRRKWGGVLPPAHPGTP